MTDRPGRVRVLYVDGEREARSAVATRLEGTTESLEVTTAEGVAAALDRLEVECVDCVLAAHTLADGTSHDLLDAVGTLDREVPVVVYPAEGSEALAASVVAAGADGYCPQTGDGYGRVAAELRRVVRERPEGAEKLDRMTDAFFAVDGDWRFTYLNDEGREILREAIGRDYTAKELRGRRIWAEIPELRGTTFGERYREAMETQEAVSFEEYYEPLETWFEVRAYPSASGLSVYFSDVTDRKRYEQTLEHRESVLTRMYRIVADRHSSFAEKVDRLFAIGREEFDTEYATLSRVDGDRYVFEYVQTPPGDDSVERGDEVSLSWTSCEDVVSTGERLAIGDVATRAPAVAERTGNRELGIECYLGSPVVVDGDVYGTFCFYGTEARTEPFSQWELALVDLMGNWVSHECERRLREEELARERNRLEEFASVVSHDLRNPLNVAVSHLELARDECHSQHLADVGDALERMETLVDDVLALARLGQQVVDEEPVALANLVRTTWSSVADDPASLDVGDVGAVVGDETRLRQLFENLFRNALEHGGEDVTVGVGPLEDGFYVADDGPGVPAGEHDAVFERGYTTRERGTGFGLAIVEEVVLAHGGAVAVTDSETGGARFEITGLDGR